jgi:putative aldouronate transport system substrate-binding protein
MEKAKRGAPLVAAGFYNKTMAAKYGIGDINTLDDFMAACKTIKEKASGVTPLIFNSAWGLQAVKIWNGVPNNFTYKTSDDKIDVIFNHPNYKKYLAYCNKLYREGGLLADNFAFTSR